MRPEARPVGKYFLSVCLGLKVGFGYAYVHVPSMLPSVICLTDFAFNPPWLLTMGARASFWYCEKDQSLGLVVLEEPIGLEELSRRNGLRRWWASRPYAAPERPSAAVAHPKRGRWKRRDIIV